MFWLPYKSVYNLLVEGFLLVDANNAFNSLNYTAALKYIQCLCMSCFLHCSYEHYQFPAAFCCKVATTQGDPLAILFYALATLPLIHKLPKSILQV